MWKYAFWVVLLALPAPFLAIEWSRMWQSGFYSYLPLLLVAFASLFLIRWDRILRMPENRFSQFLIAAGLMALTYATLSSSPWMGSFSWILFVGAFLLSQTGKDIGSGESSSALSLLRVGGASSVALIWPLTWMAIRLPLNFDRGLVEKVEILSLKMSSFMLDLVGVPHRIFVDLIELRGVRIPIDQIYSGIQATYVLCFLSILLVVVLGRSPWLVPIYMSAGVFWSLLMNVMRIVPTMCARAWRDWDWTTSWQHVVLNLLALAVVTLCLLSTDRLFKVVFFPTKPDGLASKPNPIVTLWNRLFWRHTQQAGPALSGNSIKPS